MKRSVNRRESGQSAVESAIILPLQVFFTLGIIQLTMMQHAKIMTEYAAFQAARAGVVWNGNNERMHDAAILALTPTMGNTSDLGNLALTWGKAMAWDLILARMQFSGLNSFNGAQLMGQVRVDTITPSWWTPIQSLWKLETANWKELDFDGPDSYPEIGPVARFIQGLFNVNYQDNTEQAFRESTVLSIRLRYFYELRIPFANYVIFTAWFASNANLQLYGAIYAPTLDPSKKSAVSGGSLVAFPTARGIDHEKGYNTVYWPEMQILWLIGRVGVPVIGKKYFIPLSATYSMRMQSNFHRKWLMHLNSGNWDS